MAMRLPEISGLLSPALVDCPEISVYDFYFIVAPQYPTHITSKNHF